MDDLNGAGATVADGPSPLPSTRAGGRQATPAADPEVAAIMTTTAALEQLRAGARTKAASTVLEVMGQLEELPGPARQTVREVIATLDALAPPARGRVLAFLAMRYGGQP